jgi:DNA-binding NarL/FixJ family response regulator
MSKIRIVVADDHRILLDGLRSLLQKQVDIELVSSYGNGEDLLNELKTTKPDVVLTDVNMPGMNGIVLTEKIKEWYPSIAVIVLSMFDDEDHIMEAIEAGVSGYLLKNVGDAELIDAIRSVSNGKTYFSSEISEKIALIALTGKRKQQQPEDTQLTARELEILKLVAIEYSNAQIAETLFISERTVETHRKNMLRKTNNKSIVGLIKYAIGRKLI